MQAYPGLTQGEEAVPAIGSPNPGVTTLSLLRASSGKGDGRRTERANVSSNPGLLRCLRLDVSLSATGSLAPPGNLGLRCPPEFLPINASIPSSVVAAERSLPPFLPLPNDNRAPAQPCQARQGTASLPFATRRDSVRNGKGCTSPGSRRLREDSFDPARKPRGSATGGEDARREGPALRAGQEKFPSLQRRQPT